MTFNPLNMKKFKFPPSNGYGTVFAIVRILDKTYVCPGWHEVPQGTTREQIEFDDDIIIESKKDSAELKPVKPQPQKIEHKVTSSNGKTEYTVKFDRNMWSCTCPASTFRRGHCKHIKMFETKLEKQV